MLRTIRRLHPAYRDDIGDLSTVRPLPGPQLDRLGAFLFLNHHGPQTYPPNNRGLPFGPHPHRGFETVTFILDGELAHRDSAGHESIIGEGGVQWMTAGRGIVHAEVSPDRFLKSGGHLEILQLWVNLPARLKMSPPRYTGLQGDAIPKIGTPDGEAAVNLMSGSWGGQDGPFQSLTGVFMSTVEAKGAASVHFDGLQNRDVFFYVARGSASVNGASAPAFNLVETSPGEAIDIALAPGSVIVFGHADPINEPVVAYGPFVMNTPDEIRQAYMDFQAGRFG
jgi:redox-sensitive bicupin YhaK (pirin superfamily)